ncbi:sigma-70 family RNA polymerase sigma factor [Chitinophaga sp. OAE865]|uniref:RNA polymerase sigma factor n=1 Tax=Chitinophaga sp. OAE865 TaxID=2817898 RepID=UPI001AE8DA6E
MNNDLLPQLFKTEYSKIIAVLCKLFGLPHIETAEDITNDTFLLAAETWGLKGVPENPVAWLYTVAKNKTKDYLKRDKIFSEKVSAGLKLQPPPPDEIDIDLSAANIQDSQLKMMFAICHPAIPPEARIGLSLRILCGFGIEEIAATFLTSKETINKRLFRAKEKLRTEKITIALPGEADIAQRLDDVLTTIYLLFNEGYYSTTQHQVMRKELCLEAMRLNYFMLENAATNTPAVNALMSLMCFHASRFEARTNDAGAYILYEEQDRNLWNDELISRGNYYLIESARGTALSKYHLEASIAYWHCTQTTVKNKWDNILQLYNQLLQLSYSPVTALNRTYALSKVSGKTTAIKEAEKLNLSGNHLFHSLLGYLYTGIDNARALHHFTTALQLAKTSTDKNIISQYLHKIQSG